MKGKGRKIPLKTVLICGVSIYAITLGIFVWSARIEDDTQRNFLLAMSGTGVSSQPKIQLETSETKAKLTAKYSGKTTTVTSNSMSNNRSLVNMDRIHSVGSYSNYSTGVGTLSNTANKSYHENMRVSSAMGQLPASQFQKKISENETNNTIASIETNSTPFNDLRKDWGGGDGDEDPFEPGGDEEDPGSSVDTPIGSAWPFLLVCAGLYLFLIYRKQSSKT